MATLRATYLSIRWSCVLSERGKVRAEIKDVLGATEGPWGGLPWGGFLFYILVETVREFAISPVIGFHLIETVG